MNFRFFALCLLAVLATSKPISQYPNFQTKSGLAFALSGAGGRLSQQNALSQTLINGTYPGGIKLIPSYLAGVSSGALSAVGLNGALENLASNGTAGWTFGQWNQYVFDLDNSDIYKSGVRGTIDALTNLDDGYVLNNDVLVNTLNQALSDMGYSVLGDLFLPTYITVVDLRTGLNLRLLSTDPVVSNLPLIEVLMATTAIPVAFQPRYIPSLTNNTVFVDGGTGIDYIPAIPLLNGALPVETIYALVPNKDTDNGSNGDNSDIEQNSIVRNILKTFEIQGNNLMQGDLAILANANATSFLYSAILNRTFSTLEFGETELQYNLTRNWAANNNPQRITTEGTTTFDRNLPQYYKEGSPLVFGTLSLNNSAIGWGANLAIVVLCATFALF